MNVASIDAEVLFLFCFLGLNDLNEQKKLHKILVQKYKKILK